MNYIIRFTLILTSLLLPAISTANDLRQITTDDGLSNSAILSLYHDSRGFLWVGTCDGVNIYDGSNVYQARHLPEYSKISGNIIENIMESTPGTVWIQTNYGFNRINTSDGSTTLFPDFQGKEKIRLRGDGTVFALAENSTLSYSPISGNDFKPLVTFDTQFDDIKDFIVSDSYIRLFTSHGITDYQLTLLADGTLACGSKVLINNDCISYAFNDGDNTLAIDTYGNILEYRPGDRNPSILHNISSEIERHGEISDMLRDNNGNIFVSFLTDGVIKINKTLNNSYSVENLGIDVGVFCLEKSDEQNVVWIGTDCHGVYTYTSARYSLQSVGFSNFHQRMTRPVRAIHIDNRNNLWLGTKGDGVLLVNDFDETDARNHGNETLFNTSNSALSHNSVFAFAASSRPILWIATDEGLNYYSYTDNRIKRIDTGDIPLKRIYSIQESDDSTLIATTLGYGVFKARIAGNATAPVLTEIKQYCIDNGNFSSNYFFSQALDNNGAPIFCNRGFGAFELRSDSLFKVSHSNLNYENKTIFDVFSAIRHNDVIWLGTGYGLMKILNDREQLFAGSENGFINNTIHAMLKDNDDNLWLSTNQGLIRFDTKTEKTHIFARNYGLTVTEFSDGASFKTRSSFLFGGVDGFVVVSRNPDFRAMEKYTPSISLIRLSIAGIEEPLSEHISYRQGSTRLSLENDQNYFSLTYAAPDFLNPADYNYFYTLDGKVWINNGSSANISFTRLEHGDYTLQLKFVNRETGVESRPMSLDISIAAPWYLSDIAKLVYLIVIIALIYAAVKTYTGRQRSRQMRQMEKMEQLHKEEVYEEKLRFFTNITHEFCTPLTLIFGSCERILANSDINDYMHKYVKLIRSNTERLNSLIQDLIDFRRIETGHKKRLIRSIGVSELCNDIYRQFLIIAEQNEITFENDIEPGITFNTDYKAILRIMSNLLSNAFKYTPAKGTVRLAMKLNGENLEISVYNTGKGISDADKAKIFNRYSILDNVEENATRGLSSRNGLGMAICSSLVEMLDGSIEITSEIQKYALFTVSLPPQDIEDDETGTCTTATTLPAHEIQVQAVSSDITTGIATPTVTNHNNILVIDDNKDILTLLSDSLCEYNIITAGNATEGLEILKNNTIDLIITDIMMPGTDGVTLTRNIKNNRHTMHIPIIILSARNTSTEKVEGLASGADAYVGKPFHLSYLRAVIARLIENQARLKEYYNTSASAFEYSNGQLVDKESKQFVERVIEFIDSNIDDTELSTEPLAKHMQMSVRNLYRRFKELELPSPNDFIKTHRIKFAAKLLVTTSLTVQEIIYRCGFNNRSHFYREFDKQFGMTPKDYRNSNKTKNE